MDAKHTPGPWLREGNTIYALMHDGWRKGVEQFRNRFFAQVQVDVSCGDEERNANALLIAAAPEQNTELTTAIEIIEKYGSDPAECVRRPQAWLPNGCAAIAKATGSEK